MTTATTVWACPTCGVEVESISGSGLSANLVLGPCGHTAYADRIGKRLLLRDPRTLTH